MTKELLSVEDGKNHTREKTWELYRDHINPGMVLMMSLLEFDVPFVRAEGIHVFDRDGNEYLDFLAGYGPLGLGHSPPEVWAALDRGRGMPVLLQASFDHGYYLGRRFGQLLPFLVPQICGDLKPNLEKRTPFFFA